MPDTQLYGQAVCHPINAACCEVGKQNIAHGDVFVLARARTEYAADIRTKLVKVSKIIPNYGGLLKGLAQKVNIRENGLSRGYWNQTMCMVVIQFPSMELATRWSDSDPVFREKDFPRPGHAIEMIAVPLLHIPPPGFSTFQITSFMVPDHDVEKFQREYIDEASKFYHKHKVCYSVALSNDVKNMRSGWVSSDKREYVAIHMFPNEQVLDELTKDPDYLALKSTLNRLSVSTTIVFTVQRDTSDNPVAHWQPTK